jgi:uncharacterized protein
MIKTLTPIIGIILLLTLSVNSIAQSKNAPRSKPAAATKKPAKPAKDEVKEEMQETKIGANPNDTTPPVALPPLPEIDTVPPPNDELTAAIKQLIEVTNGMNTSKTVMKGSLESQRKLNPNQVPDEFYVRMLAAVESGQVNGYIENIVVKVYRQKFTLEEVKEVVKFYDSPIGKKMAVEAPVIANAARMEGEKVGQYVALKIIADMMKEGKWK